tara:strand:+ start:250 stop:618 length:369 start_codon:yes stop_codon:yes gene_type:complete
MNLSRCSFLFIVISCFLLIVPAAHSASIKERMAARIPEINALKDQGLVGENNMGFLEYRTAARPKKELIAAENADRDRVYKAIAKSQKASLQLVSQKRAQMIVENGPSGHWYQKPDGTWYKK